MTRIAAVDPSTAEASVSAALAAVKGKIGMVPNLLKTFAQSPAVLNGYLAFSEALKAGALTARQREIIALTVGQANGCHYCLSAHTLAGKGAGLSADDIRKAREGGGNTAIEDAVAVFARRVVDLRGQVLDADIAAARRAGLTDPQIIETIAGVALNVFTNYTNNVALTDIDFPKVDVELPAAA